MDARTRMVALLSLASLAFLAVVGAVLTVALAPDATPTLLGVCLGVLILVVAAEIVLVALDRRKTA